VDPTHFRKILRKRAVQLNELAAVRAGYNLLSSAHEQLTSCRSSFLRVSSDAFSFAPRQPPSVTPAPFRHDATMSLQFQRDADDFRHNGHLQIQRVLTNSRSFQTSGPDVTPIFAQVRGDAVRAGGSQSVRLDRVRLPNPRRDTRLAERRDMSMLTPSLSMIFRQFCNTV